MKSFVIAELAKQPGNESFAISMGARGMVRKHDKVLCCMFLFTFLALTVHKTQYFFTPY